jgi:hypothetical protein
MLVPVYWVIFSYYDLSNRKKEKRDLHSTVFSSSFSTKKMKVFITATPEVNPNLTKQIQGFLSKVGGPIEFHDLGISNLEGVSSIFPEIKNMEDLEKLDSEMAIKLGKIIKFKQNLPEENILALITTKELCIPSDWTKTWFSFYESNIIVVRNKELDQFSKGKWPFVMGHQIIENIFQMLSDSSYIKASSFVHVDPKGCINDLCSYPPQIEFKLRMAYICNECLKRAYGNNIDPNFLKQIKDSIELVRTKLDNFTESISIEDLSPVIVNQKGEIFIDNKEIELQDLPKALYLFFLKKPGVAIQNQHLRGYKDDLEKIYKKIKRGGHCGPLYKLLGLDERGEKTVSYVNTDALKNHRYYISKEIKSKFGEAKAEYYQIKSWRKKTENTPQFYNQIGIPQELIDIPYDF